MGTFDTTYPEGTSEYHSLSAGTFTTVGDTTLVQPHFLKFRQVRGFSWIRAKIYPASIFATPAALVHAELQFWYNGGNLGGHGTTATFSSTTFTRHDERTINMFVPFSMASAIWTNAEHNHPFEVNFSRPTTIIPRMRHGTDGALKEQQVVLQMAVKSGGVASDWACDIEFEIQR